MVAEAACALVPASPNVSAAARVRWSLISATAADGAIRSSAMSGAVTVRGYRVRIT